MRGLTSLALALVILGASVVVPPKPRAAAEENDAGGATIVAQCLVEASADLRIGWLEARVDPSARVALDVREPMALTVDLSPSRYCVVIDFEGAGVQPAGDGAEWWRSWVRGFAEDADADRVGEALVFRLHGALDCFRLLDVAHFNGPLHVGVAYSEANCRTTIERYGLCGEPGDGGDGGGWRAYVAREIESYVTSLTSGRAYEPQCPSRRVYGRKRGGSEDSRDYVVLDTVPLEGWHWVGSTFFSALRTTDISAWPEVDLTEEANCWFGQHARRRGPTDSALVMAQSWIGSLIPPRPWGEGWRLESTETRDPYWGCGTARLQALLARAGGAPLRCALLAERTPSGSVFVMALAPESASMDMWLETKLGNMPKQRVRCQPYEVGSAERLPLGATLAASFLQEAGAGAWGVTTSQEVEVTRTDSGLLKLGSIAHASIHRDHPDVPMALAEILTLPSGAGFGDRYLNIIATGRLCSLCEAYPGLLLRAMNEDRPRETATLLRVLGGGGAVALKYAAELRRWAECDNTLIAGAAMEAYVELTGQLGPIIAALTKLLEGDDLKVRRRGAFVAGCIRAADESIVGRLRTLTTDEHVEVQRMAAAALIRSGAATSQARRIMRELAEDPQALDGWLVGWAEEHD